MNPDLPRARAESLEVNTKSERISGVDCKAPHASAVSKLLPRAKAERLKGKWLMHCDAFKRLGVEKASLAETRPQARVLREVQG